VRLLLAAVGRLKPGAERDLCARYMARATAAGRQVGLTEIAMREAPESRAPRASDRCVAEGASIRSWLSPGVRLVVLDERGRNLSSVGFADDIRQARDRGTTAYALAVGGPDGLDPSLRDEADLTLAFGAMTWPHQLVRVMIAEQIYRATTILAGHPYHRA
jgi:23S rRNA (pseudouridine1915-N3)-methyltransferase